MSVAGAGAIDAAGRIPQNLPVEIAFLAHYGVASGFLLAAAAKARAQRVTADTILLAAGEISEDRFYRSLARHLRLPFADSGLQLAAAIDYPQCVKSGVVPLAGLERTTFLAAPRGRAIGEMTTSLRHGTAHALVITTPTHLSELVQATARREISEQASLGLWSSNPGLSAKGGASRKQLLAALLVGGALAAFWVLAPKATEIACNMMLSLGFLAVIWLRLAASAAGRQVAEPPPVASDAELPIYSIVVALYREARVVPQLLAGDSWITRLFAIEYAALFHVINVGFGALRLPFPLGGSSNHFRVDVLRKIGGWDAWNVTEDADIGLRLARLGYYAETFASVTYEEAPAQLRDFLGQRRRWCKGWYQTLIVLLHNPIRLVREFGPARCATALLVLLSYAVAPLVGPLCALWLGADAVLGRLQAPSGSLQIWLATLWISVCIAGVPAILWPALAGLKRRGLLSLWPWLSLLPLYSLLICFAAWISLYDLVRRPQHWYKTEHGLAKTSRRQILYLLRERTPAPSV